MGNIGAGYAFGRAHGPLVTAGVGFLAEFAQGFEGVDAAVGSWRDNLKGIAAAAADDPIGAIVGVTAPVAAPLVNWAREKLRGVRRPRDGPDAERRQ